MSGTHRSTSTGRTPVADLLEGRDLYVVSNRQPYSHEHAAGGIEVTRPTGGLSAALDPVMQELEGTWIAWGDGSADEDVVDEDDRVAVPPEDPAYDLRRLWLGEEALEGYYYGYSNRVLWPLCHCLPSKVTYEEDAWEWYRRVNRQFADAVLDEVTAEPAVVWFNDYHFGLAPRMVSRNLDEDAILAHFWHVPWPPWDVFRRGPRTDEILPALLSNDLVGFHTTHDRRQFVRCAEKLVGATYDPATGTLTHDGDRTVVRTAPIQIDADVFATHAESDRAGEYWESFVDEHGLGDVRVALGVDRLDYTKGIEERLDALERLWEREPAWRGSLTYVQSASESRGDIREYQELQRDVETRIEEINRRFGTDDWQPIVYLTEFLSQEELGGLYRNVDVAIVSPRRDGLNLVAKEFIASRVDEDGALVLSDTAGVIEELDDSALTVNPLDTESFADTIDRALEMPADERAERMSALAELVRSTGNYDWIEGLFAPLAEGADRGHPISAEDDVRPE